MNGLQYAIDLVDKGFGLGIKKAKQQTEGLDNAMKKGGRTIADVTVRGKRNISKLDSTIGNLKNTIVAAFALGSIIAFGNEVTRVTAKFEGFENAILFASGEEGAKNLEFLDNKIKALSLDMGASYKGFQILSGALKGTEAEGKGVRDIFTGVATAAAVMNLTAEQSEGAFTALAQIASKGKVQAEEIRGQLGERIPGALNIAARAMGVNQAQFNKMLELGQVYAEDFLPKFARELKNTFGGGLEKAANSMQAAINKKNNAILSFKKTIGESLRPEIKAFLETGAEMMNWLRELIPHLEPVKQAFGNLFRAFSPIITAFETAGTSIGGTTGIINLAAAAINAAAIVANILAEGIGFMIENFAIVTPLIVGYSAVMKVMAWQQAAAAAGTSLLTFATKGLTAAFAANPIGFILVSLIALIGIVKYAWKNFETFRGVIKAAGVAAFGFSMTIKNYVINRFKEILGGVMGIGSAILKFFKGDWDGALKAGKEGLKNLMGGDARKKLIDDLKTTGKLAGKVYSDEIVNATKKAKIPAPEGMADYIASTNKKKAPQELINSLAGVSGGGTEGKNNGVATSGSNTLSAGGGRTEKHLTINIESFVKELTIKTTNLTGDPSAIKAQMQRIFQELTADLEQRMSHV